MEDIHNTQYDRHWQTQPLDTVCEAPADPPLDTECDASADPPLDNAHADLVDSPLQNMRECRILGSSIQDWWEHEQCLMLGSWRNGNKTQPVMDIWLKYV